MALREEQSGFPHPAMGSGFESLRRRLRRILKIPQKDTHRHGRPLTSAALHHGAPDGEPTISLPHSILFLYPRRLRIPRPLWAGDRPLWVQVTVRCTCGRRGGQALSQPAVQWSTGGWASGWWW